MGEKGTAGPDGPWSHSGKSAEAHHQTERPPRLYAASGTHAVQNLYTMAEEMEHAGAADKQNADVQAVHS